MQRASFFNAFILLLFIFNAGGVRLISNSAITIIIIALLLVRVQKNKRFDKKLFLISMSFFSVVLLTNYMLTNFGLMPIKHVIYWSYALSASLLVAMYQSSRFSFYLDLRLALMFFAGHAMVGFILQFVLEPARHFQSIDVRDIAYLFFYPKVDTFSFIHRNSGLFWEPGVLQLFMNLLLFLSLFVRKNLYLSLFAVVIIVSTLSTVGLLIMAVQIVYYFYMSLNKKSIILFPLYAIVAVLVAWVAVINLQDKMESKSSGVRMFDLVVGTEILRQNPMFGIGLNSDKFVQEVGRIGGGFQSLFHISDEELEGKGLTNGVLSLFVTFGVPIALILLFLLYKQKVLPHSMLFFFILTMSALSEPIVQTAFFMVFMVFGLSAMVGRTSKRKKNNLYRKQLVVTGVV